MGWNTTVIVRNDAIGAIERDAEFGKRLSDAVVRAISPVSRRDLDIRAGGHGNAASVIETHHAGQMVPVLVGGNMGRVLSDAYISYTADDVLALRAIANRMGYRLVKKGK